MHLRLHIDRRTRLRQLGAHALLQLLHQAIGHQPIDSEQFVVFHHLVFLLKAHQQTVAQKAAGGVAQKIGQTSQRERHFGIGLELCHLRQRRCSRLLVCGVPLPGIGAQARGLLKIAAAEGLQRVLPAALRQKVATRFTTPALYQIVAQLRDQH